MKKFTRIIGVVCMMGLLTFVSTSCKKNQENSETTINVVVSGLEEEGERAYLNQNYEFFWHENDYIRVYNLADEANADESATAVHSKIGTYTGPIARFRGPSVGPKKAEGFRYFYPVEMVKGNHDEINMNLWNENRQVFQISNHQEYHLYQTSYHPHASMVDGQAMPMTVAVDKLTDEATLEQLFGAASFQMRVSHEYQGEVVVDSVKLVDNYHNISGEFSLKLHEFSFEDYMMAWNQYFNEYHGFTDEYYQNIILPLYETWGYYETNYGHEITLNCMHEQDGEIKGVTLGTAPYYTEFPIMLRPLALSEGFHLYIYLEGFVEPIVLDENDFYRPGHQYLDYTWAIKPGTIKRYIMRMPIDSYLE